MWKLPFSLSGRVCLCFSGLSFYFLSTVSFSCRCVVLLAFFFIFVCLFVALLRRSGSMLLCSWHCLCFRAVCVVCLVFVLTVLFALFVFFVLCDFFVSCLRCCIDCVVPVVPGVQDHPFGRGQRPGVGCLGAVERLLADLRGRGVLLTAPLPQRRVSPSPNGSPALGLVD